MKKYIAISFLLVYAFSTTLFLELLKIPFLIEHYSEHKTNDDSIGFTDFLKMHYLSDATTTDTSSEKDHKLPFKTVNAFTSTIYTPLTQPISFSFLILNKEINQNKINYYYLDFKGFSYLDSIWQPPKLV